MTFDFKISSFAWEATAHLSLHYVSAHRKPNVPSRFSLPWTLPLKIKNSARTCKFRNTKNLFLRLNIFYFLLVLSAFCGVVVVALAL